MSFEEQSVNRDTAGRFDEKPQSAAEARLPAADAFPWAADLPVSARAREAFSGVHSWEGVDTTFTHLLDSAETGWDELDALWAGVQHGRTLRDADVPCIPTSLPESNMFALCQNRTELQYQMALAEEMCGEVSAEAGHAAGQRMRARTAAEMSARLAELSGHRA